MRALEAGVPKPIPVHVEVGRHQRKLRQVEHCIVRLAQKLQDAALAIIEKQDKIVQLDMEIEIAPKDFAEAQDKLASIRRRSLPEAVIPFGLDRASLGVRQKAAD